MNENEVMDSWKQFQGTELGSLLGSIYGRDSRTKINYPKPKIDQNKVKNDGNRVFLPVNGMLNSTDPRKFTKKKVDLKVPGRFGAGNEGRIVTAVDGLVRRKNKVVIDHEIEEIRMRQMYYRPAYRKNISCDEEKERLNQIFSYKGGKALPEELTNPVHKLTPYEIAERQKENERMNNVKIYKGNVIKNYNNNTMKSMVKQINPNDELANQIKLEIDERMEYIETMKNINGKLDKNEEKRLLLEIHSRANELKLLESDL